ncbi:MAG: hypothetical protein JW844_04710 [Candidatus Omnitrophica bacterium]|nr:hypothetical protein [Candidatus Omnitrophota bacterium]
MSLDEFLKGIEENRKKGEVIISRRKIQEMLSGKIVIYEYISPDAEKLRAQSALKFGQIKLTGNKAKDDTLLSLYSDEIVLETKKGYYGGRLDAFDGSYFHLGQRVFSDKPIDFISYRKQRGTKTEMVPEDEVVTIYKMPIKNTDDFYRTRVNHKK